MKKRNKTDIDSMEIRIFDRRGGEVFKWRKAPRNIKPGLAIMRKKGIDLGEYL